MRPTVVIGLGNPLMSDEGIGLHLVRALLAQAWRFSTVDFYELGTGGMAVLHLLAGRRKAVLLDCAQMGEPPGTLRRFTPEQVSSVKALARFSLHEGDLLAILELSGRLGECPASVVIYGVQPAHVAPGDTLSSALAGRVGEYARSIAAELTAPP